MREFEDSTTYSTQVLPPRIYDELFSSYNDMFSAENFSRFIREQQDGFLSSSAALGESHVEQLTHNGTDFGGEDPHDLHTGRKALGQSVIDHLEDWNWLIKNKGKLRLGLEWAYGKMTPDAFERLIAELNTQSDGKIYFERGNGLIGSLNPLNPPCEQVVRVYLKRGGLLTDDKVLDSRRLPHPATYTAGRTHDSNR